MVGLPHLPVHQTTSTGGGGASEAGGAGAGGAGGAGTGGAGGALPTGLAGHIADTRFVTADAMFAAVQMQISGEPFAELLGRDLGGYDRFSDQTDMYLDPESAALERDVVGWSLAIESYEYSKQPMNQLSFEAGAGVPLMFGPLVNPEATIGDPAYQALSARLQYLARASRASGANFGKDFVVVPPPADDPDNAYGWPGFFPVCAEYRSFDPAFEPSVGADAECSLAGATDEPLPPGTMLTYVGDYECDATSLNLPNREAQVEKVLSPEALGLATWKQSLWVINYFGSLHDVDQHPIVEVRDEDLALVGIPENSVIGRWPNPLDPSGEELVFGKPGTYFGDVSLEGFQGLVMLDEIDNKAALLMARLSTGDGATLSGFGAEAIDYDYEAPLRWWPAAVDVEETATAPSPDLARKFFPRPASFTIASGASRARDLSALLGGFAEVVAMTDPDNPEIGGSAPFLAAFDGDPFDASTRARALAIMKVALVDLDRLHFDDEAGVIVDEASVDGGAVTRGQSVTTASLLSTISALRTAYRGLTGSIALYSNDTPDEAGVPSAIDGTSDAGAPFDGTYGARIRDLVAAQARFLADRIVDDDGLAANGYDLASGERDPSPSTLESQCSAILGLLEGYLATSDTAFRDRAKLAYAALAGRFYMADVRAYRTEVDESSTMTWTPRTLGAFTGALRQLYKLVGRQPGNEALASEILDRLARTMKLVVNGWNDINGDAAVDAGECLDGRLQMAERALTGERSIEADGGDRDHDCVPDIASAKLPAALAHSFVLVRQ